MAFQVSPGVQVIETDATNVVPAVSTSIGGFAGAFNWGPVDQIVTVGSEKELVNTFGSPDALTAKYFLTAAAFLKYGKSLKVVRTLVTAVAEIAEVVAVTADPSATPPVVGVDAVSAVPAVIGMSNATADGSGILIKNDDQYLNSYVNGTGDVGLWAAKYPGVLGNSIKVSMITAGVSSGSGVNTIVGGWESWSTDYKALFATRPGTSEHALTLGHTAANDEMHIVVIDEDGAITGTKGTILETFAYVSQASDARKPDGSTNYYKEIINSKSAYIRWMDHFTISDGATPPVFTASTAGSTLATTPTFSNVGGDLFTVSMTGGSDNNTPPAASVIVGLDQFIDAETVDVNLLFAYPDANGSDVIAQKLLEIAKTRKDCMAFVSPPIEDSVGSATPAADVTAWAEGLPSTSYGSTDSTALYVYDKYNDVYRWVGASGHIAGLCANVDDTADTWFSPAGVTRGQLFGVTKLAHNPKKADRDTLYKARVNPIVAFPGQGTMLFGDKTLLAKPSAFDRINVRRLFIAIEKAIAIAAKAQLFEFNDEFTRAQFRNLLEPFLRDVKGRRGLTDFMVVCDTTNNDGGVVDGNRFVADIFIKPTRSINFITLNFIATRTGVDFSEIAGV